MRPDKVAGKDKIATRLFSSLQQGSECCGPRQLQHLGAQPTAGQRSSLCWVVVQVPSIRGWVSGVLPISFWTTPPAAQFGFVLLWLEAVNLHLPQQRSQLFLLSVPPLTPFSPVLSLSPPEHPILQEASLNRNLHGRGDNIKPNISDYSTAIIFIIFLPSCQ